jgi:hypothetical protein
MAFPSCYFSDTLNSEVARRFLENSCSPVLKALSITISNLVTENARRVSVYKL